MSFERQLAFWLATFVVIIVLLWLLSEILLPFVAGMVIAYLLDPMTNRLERLGVNRRFAALLIVGAFVLVVVALLLVLVPPLANQLYAFIGNFPGYVTRLYELALSVDVPWLREMLGSGDSSKTLQDLVREGAGWLAGFVRGQSGVCLILGSYYALSLSVVGLNFALLIGLIAGLISFIPFVGSISGLLLGIGVAIAQFWPEWTPIATVFMIFMVGQFVEGYILAPKFVGENVGLHPVWLMFAMFAFGYLFGFVGLLVAVPVSAAIGVLLRFALRNYRASTLYTGEPAS